MEFSAEVAFPASAGEVAKMFATEAYVAEKIRASGGQARELEVLGTPDRPVKITSRRAMPTDDIPANYRSLVGSTVEIRQVDAWEAPKPDGGRKGTIVIEMLGAPVRVTGTMDLRATSDTSCTLRIAGEVKASVPFFGKAIEKALVGSVDKAADVEREVGLRWLAEH